MGSLAAESIKEYSLTITRPLKLSAKQTSLQARRQNSLTGGGRNKFWGAREDYLREFERGTGAR